MSEENHSTLIPDKPAIANATAVVYPLEVSLPITIKFKVSNTEEHELLTDVATGAVSMYFIADLFDSLDEGFDDVVSINNFTRVDVQKFLHEQVGAQT